MKNNLEIKSIIRKTPFMSALIRISRDALKLSFDLFKIMVPIIIAVKILQELDWIKYIAIPLAPVMKLVGLPGEMGLVWATAILNNLYGALVVLLSFVKDTPISTAQATVLCTMMLVAHTLPIELKIAQASGPRLLFQALSRLGSAIVFGWLLHVFYSGLDLLQSPANILLTQEAADVSHKQTIYSWACREVQNLLFIFIIILALFVFMQVLNKLKIIDFMNRVLGPFLKIMGIGPKASAIAMIGLTLGVSFGGGLIIHEARSGQIDKRDVFFSLTLMGLSHSLIEDTILMVMIGGHLSGILCARVLLSISAVALLVKVSAYLPTDFCERFLWGDPK
jgi:spore maturation protein SpmB